MGKQFMRRDGKLKAISTAPSINLTPMGNAKVPLPYPVVASLSNAVDCVENVVFNGAPVLVLGQSSQPSCTGDSPGSDKGVKSGTLNGEVIPTGGSPTVHAGGKAIVRHGDPCTMQGGNTVGIYVAPPSPAAPPGEGALPPENPPPRPEEHQPVDASEGLADGNKEPQVEVPALESQNLKEEMAAPPKSVASPKGKVGKGPQVPRHQPGQDSLAPTGQNPAQSPLLARPGEGPEMNQKILDQLKAQRTYDRAHPFEALERNRREQMEALQEDLEYAARRRQQWGDMPEVRDGSRWTRAEQEALDRQETMERQRNRLEFFFAVLGVLDRRGRGGRKPARPVRNQIKDVSPGRHQAKRGTYDPPARDTRKDATIQELPSSTHILPNSGDGGSILPGASASKPAGSMGQLKYEPAPYHGRKDTPWKSRGPTNGQESLDNSVPISDTTTRRVGIDYKEKEFVIFDEHLEGIFHGHIRSWDQPGSNAQNALRKAGLTNRHGKLR